MLLGCQTMTFFRNANILRIFTFLFHKRLIDLPWLPWRYPLLLSTLHFQREWDLDSRQANWARVLCKVMLLLTVPAEINCILGEASLMNRVSHYKRLQTTLLNSAPWCNDLSSCYKIKYTCFISFGLKHTHITQQSLLLNTSTHTTYQSKFLFDKIVMKWAENSGTTVPCWRTSSLTLRCFCSVLHSTANLTYDPVLARFPSGTWPRSVMLENQNNKALNSEKWKQMIPCLCTIDQHITTVLGMSCLFEKHTGTHDATCYIPINADKRAERLRQDKYSVIWSTYISL